MSCEVVWTQQRCGNIVAAGGLQLWRSSLQCLGPDAVAMTQHVIMTQLNMQGLYWLTAEAREQWW